MIPPVRPTTAHPPGGRPLDPVPPPADPVPPAPATPGDAAPARPARPDRGHQGRPAGARACPHRPRQGRGRRDQGRDHPGLRARRPRDRRGDRPRAVPPDRRVPVPRGVDLRLDRLGAAARQRAADRPRRDRGRGRAAGPRLVRCSSRAHRPRVGIVFGLSLRRCSRDRRGCVPIGSSRASSPGLGSCSSGWRRPRDRRVRRKLSRRATRRSAPYRRPLLVGCSCWVGGHSSRSSGWSSGCRRARAGTAGRRRSAACSPAWSPASSSAPSSSIDYGPRIGAAAGRRRVLRWPGSRSMLLRLQRQGIDADQLKRRFWPQETIDTTKESIEWAKARLPRGPRS